MLSALVAGMFMIGSIYAQTPTPATGKPVTKQESTSGAKTDKPAKHHKKGKGTKNAGTTKPAAAPKTETKPAEQK